MWRLDTTPAIWCQRDEVKNKRVLFERIDVKIPDTFSWTREADRPLILGSYGEGPMSEWLQPPPDQTCCGYCYAVSTAGWRSRALGRATSPGPAGRVGSGGPGRLRRLWLRRLWLRLPADG
jgi:hypothetical protein